MYAKKILLATNMYICTEVNQIHRDGNSQDGQKKQIESKTVVTLYCPPKDDHDTVRMCGKDSIDFKFLIR